MRVDMEAVAADAAATEPRGRREENKRRTHQALVEAAARLFQERGFEATTVRDIAAEAGVGERTFFRYFPSKESLVLQQVRDLIPLLAAGICERPADEPPLVALREALLALAFRHETNPVILLAIPGPLRLEAAGRPADGRPADGRSADGRPEVPGRGDRFLLYDLEEAVAEAFRSRMDGAEVAGDARFRASVLSRVGVGVLRAVRLTYGRLSETEREAVDAAELVRAGFAALER
ncbi:helix-turn-helix domain-containing protein [Streptacidiphilus sp. MAP5-3]|uniref:helix-turn-helix domain-containing protein n=1 Tax=unclassified Streptacidiphilus TaxID=2643834 RepID=UPI0035174163